MSVAQLFPRRNKVEKIEVVSDGRQLWRWRKVYSHSKPAGTSTQAWMEPEGAIEAALSIAAIEETDVHMPQWLADRWNVVQFAGLHTGHEVAA